MFMLLQRLVAKVGLISVGAIVSACGSAESVHSPAGTETMRAIEGVDAVSALLIERLRHLRDFPLSDSARQEGLQDTQAALRKIQQAHMEDPNAPITALHIRKSIYDPTTGCSGWADVTQWSTSSPAYTDAYAWGRCPDATKLPYVNVWACIHGTCGTPYWHSADTMAAYYRQNGVTDGMAFVWVPNTMAQVDLP